MKSQQEILEERLKAHRATPDRAETLNQRVSANRTLLPSRKEKADRAEKNCQQGQNDLYWKWSKETPEAVARFDEAVGVQATMAEPVRPAIAFGSGILSLDLALGGGIASGVTEIYGKEGVGKTTMVVELVQAAQAHGLECALCCGEYFDHQRYDRVCVDLDKLVLIRGGGEDALELGANFIAGESKRALFLDSATALRPKDDHYDNWRLMMLSWLEWVTPRLSLDSTIVMVNQVRAKRSINPNKVFAGGVDSAGKRILEYFQARMELSRDAVMDDTYDLVVNIVANVLSAPAKIVTLPVHKKHGIEVWRDVVRVAVPLNVIGKHGNWYFIEFEEHAVRCNGEESAARYLEEDVAIGNDVFEKVLRALRP